MDSICESSNQLIADMLQDDIPIPVIKDRLGLDDADLIYHVTAAQEIRNRITIARDKWVKSIDGDAAEFLDVTESQVMDASAATEEQHGSVRVLEQGCGDGSFAYRVASFFPNCRVDAIDLISTRIDIARETFTIPNLELRQADG